MNREMNDKRILIFGLTAKPCPVSLSSGDFTHLV